MKVKRSEAEMNSTVVIVISQVVVLITIKIRQKPHSLTLPSNTLVYLSSQDT